MGHYQYLPSVFQEAICLLELYVQTRLERQAPSSGPMAA